MEKIDDHQNQTEPEMSASDNSINEPLPTSSDKGQEAGLEDLPPKEPPSEEPSDSDTKVYSIFTTWEKRGIVFGAAVGALLSPLTGQIYLPALPVVAADLNVSIAQVNLTMTTYMIFQGLAPMFIGSLADSAGRRPAYMICFAIYIVANIGCALAPNYGALLVLRMLQSAGSASTIALCQAVVADIITSAERGSYMAITALPSVLGPSLGPVLGGVISQYLGWRWIFWLLAIIGATFLIAHAILLPETCRYIVGDGSIRPPLAYRTLWQLCKDFLRKRRSARDARANAAAGGELGRTPSRASAAEPNDDAPRKKKKVNLLKSLALLFEIEMFVLLAYGGVVVAGVYAVLTSMATHFQGLYGLDATQVGLMYLPITGGTVAATVAVGRLQDWNFRRHCRLRGVPYDRRRQGDLAGFPIERARLEVSVPLLALSAAVMVAWGWALERRAHLAVPCVLLVLLGFALVGFSNTLWVLVADINPGNAGAATASNNIIRCLLSAVATAVIDPMTAAMGLGWAFVLFGALFAVFSPAVWLVMRNGVRWRREKEERRQRRKERKAAASAASDGDANRGEA